MSVVTVLGHIFTYYVFKKNNIMLSSSRVIKNVAGAYFKFSVSLYLCLSIKHIGKSAAVSKPHGLMYI